MATVQLLLARPPRGSWVAHYISPFNKDVIVSSLKPLLKILRGHQIEFRKGSNPALRELFMSVVNSGKAELLRKHEAADIYVSFSSSIDNAIALTEIDPGLKKILTLLATEPMVKFADLQRFASSKLALEFSSNWLPQPLLDVRLGFCRLRERDFWSYNKTIIQAILTLFISTSDRQKLLAEMLGASSLEPEKIRELPADKGLVTENFENEAAAVLQYLTGIHLAGNLIAANGHTTIVKLNTQFRKKEFKDFDPQYLEKYGSARLYHLFGVAYAAYIAWDNVDTTGQISLKELAKFVVKELPRVLSGTDFGIIIQTFSGFTKSWAEDSNAYSLLSPFMRLLKKLKTDWLSLESLNLFFLCSATEDSTHDVDEISLFNYDSMSHSGLLPKDGSAGHHSASDYRSKIHWWEDITFPFIIQWLRLLCATGIVELAIDPASVASDPLQGLRFLRLTALGRYALGIDEVYIPGAGMASGGPLFDLDDDNAVVTILQPNSPFIPFFEQISRPIGGNRFKITAADFIRSSKGGDDALKAINRFEKLVCPEPYGIWKKIIDEARMRTDIHAKGPKQYFSLFKLNADIPGLIDFIASNSEIASFTIKAQQSFILVENKSLDRFEELLHKAGYLL